MEDLIFIVLFVAVPVILLTMGFVAVLTQEKKNLKQHNGSEHPTIGPRS